MRTPPLRPGASGSKVHALGPSLAAFGLFLCVASAPRSSLAGEAAPASEPVTLGDPLPDDEAAHLALSLQLKDGAGLAELLAAQQDPRSSRYHAWLTPAEFGARFGLTEAAYSRIVDWLRAEGFAVARYPNRLFVDATGTSAGVRRLLQVQLRRAWRGTRSFRTALEAPSLPADVAPLVARIGGLDTRAHLRRALDVTTVEGQTTQALGAGDLRALYDVPSTGGGASGLTLVVLGTQEGTQVTERSTPGLPFIAPSPDAIAQYFSTISSATVAYDPIVLPNPNDDFDTAGANQEYELDVEVQSVGAPNAASIDLVLSPASEVFTTGAEYIVNSLSTAVVVSTSLGICEAEEVADDAGPDTPGSEAYEFQMTVQQGLAEGQTWFAAAGDTGADACNDQTSGTSDGYGGGNATVSFPCSMAEMICLGGTQLQTPGNWNSSGALNAWQPEVVWNEGQQGGATGGGQSLLYAKPVWQNGVGPSANDSARDVPDIALAAATADPGVAVYACGSGQAELSCQGDTTGAGSISVVGGTSVAAPLAAGFFARIAGQLGCRLGDAHPALYGLAADEADASLPPFHDVTSGNNSFVDPRGLLITGFTAGPGYDLASGWGSLDVAKLIESWPACAPSRGGEPAGIPGMGATGGTPVSSGGGCAVTGGAASDGLFAIGVGAGLAALSTARSRRGARARRARRD